ncbi:hypothetical protein [Fundicoccus culcitae]|uniref:S1 motif domain-containing protein n=1 Tax=Fundicoccus culcitae TaxID=2969821 RepID=A0ABY5P8W8_9LACT|nr:hypothetical protein [Fundicoccus culcitae]UUX35192.1 hypothetical protein NRE15_05995 [Fundicoccus culcitae]
MKHKWVKILILFLLVGWVSPIVYGQEANPEVTTIRLRIYEPEDIYEEDYPEDEIVLTGSAWINRAIHELRSNIVGIIPVIPLDEPLVKTDFYDASQLGEGIFRIQTRDDHILTLIASETEEKITFRMELELIDDLDDEEEFFSLLGYLVRTLDASIDSEKIYDAYHNHFGSGEDFMVDSVKVIQAGVKENIIVVERDLTTEVESGRYPNYVVSVPAEDEADIRLSADIFANHAEETARQEAAVFTQANTYLVDLLEGNAVEDRFSISGKRELEEIGDIYSEDYPVIEQAIVNREWLNRILVELTLSFSNELSQPGLYSYGGDAHTTYYYPNHRIEVYLFSGAFDGRQLVEVRKSKYEYADWLRKAKADEESDLFYEFATLGKILDPQLTEEDLRAGFAQFVEHNEDFTLGDLTVYQKGLREDIIYLSRDVTDEVDGGIYLDYSEGLADAAEEALITDERREVGSIANGHAIVGEDLPEDASLNAALKYSNYYYNQYRENVEVYTPLLDAGVIEGDILAVEEDEGSWYLMVDSNYQKTVLMELPKALAGEAVEVGQFIRARVRNVGLRFDVFDQLMEHYYVEGVELLEITGN